MFKITFIGDINPGGVLTFTGGVSPEVIDLLSQSDLRVGTLECAIGDGTSPCPIKMADAHNGTIIYAPDESVQLLKRMKIDVVSLANNHSLDLDDIGLDHTLNLLDKVGIKHLGAGRNIKEASEPLVINIHEKSFCFLAYLEQRIPCIRIASETKAGANPFELCNALAEIKRCKKIYDYVIVLPHWGKENVLQPRANIVNWCKQMTQAGADAVIGSHTHIFQPVIKKNKSIVAYSMGNFLFPDRYIDSPRRTVYPDEQQRSSEHIPVVHGFPLVNKLSLKVIGDKARIGGVLSVKYDNDGSSMTYEISNTILTEDNELVLQKVPLKYLRSYNRVQWLCEHPLVFQTLHYCKIIGKTIDRKLK